MIEKILQNKICFFLQDPYLCTPKVLKQYAEVAQLVEHDLAKVGVAGSSLVFRSFDSIPEPFGMEFFFKILGEVYHPCSGSPGGGIGRRAGLKILYAVMRVRVQFPSGAPERKGWNYFLPFLFYFP